HKARRLIQVSHQSLDAGGDPAASNRGSSSSHDGLHVAVDVGLAAPVLRDRAIRPYHRLLVRLRTNPNLPTLESLVMPPRENIPRRMIVQIDEARDDVAARIDVIEPWVGGSEGRHRGDFRACDGNEPILDHRVGSYDGPAQDDRRYQ